MGVYNRKSWYHNGTKHWIHNGKHYHKRLGFFGTKKKYKKNNTEKKHRFSDSYERKNDICEPIFDKKWNKKRNKILLNQYFDDGHTSTLELSYENGKYYLYDYNSRRAPGEETIKKEITKDNAIKWYKKRGKIHWLDEDIEDWDVIY